MKGNLYLNLKLPAYIGNTHTNSSKTVHFYSVIEWTVPETLQQIPSCHTKSKNGVLVNHHTHDGGYRVKVKGLLTQTSLKSSLSRE